MEFIDLIAILGALAWLPHLISLARYWFTRPEVTIITPKSAQLGFTNFGPIFNVPIAFAVKNHDIVISNFRVSIIHESGEERFYEWQGLMQHMGKIQTNEGPIPYDKENSVLAIKLSQKEVEERFVRFQEMSFVADKHCLEDKVIKRLSYARDQKGYELLNFIDCQEFTEVYSYIKQSFSWRPGKYKVIFDLSSSEEFSLVDNKYEFTLTPIDIEELERNKDSIRQSCINTFVTGDSPDYKNISWNWRYPSIRKLN